MLRYPTTAVTVTLLELFSLGMNDPGRYGVKWDGVEGACWFVVPMFIWFVVGPVRGAGVLTVFGNNR